MLASTFSLRKIVLIKHPEQMGKLEFQTLTSILSEAKSERRGPLHTHVILSVICHRNQRALLKPQLGSKPGLLQALRGKRHFQAFPSQWHRRGRNGFGAQTSGGLGEGWVRVSGGRLTGAVTVCHFVLLS